MGRELVPALGGPDAAQDSGLPAVAGRGGRAAVGAVLARGAGMIALVSHEAVGGPVVYAGNLLVIVLGYLIILAILVVFGIWGFRLGSKGSGGHPPGGGPKRPEPVPPPSGGRELDGERMPSDLDLSRGFEIPGAQEPAPEPERELVAPGPRV